MKEMPSAPVRRSSGREEVDASSAVVPREGNNTAQGPFNHPQGGARNVMSAMPVSGSSRVDSRSLLNRSGRHVVDPPSTEAESHSAVVPRETEKTGVFRRCPERDTPDPPGPDETPTQHVTRSGWRRFSSRFIYSGGSGGLSPNETQARPHEAWSPQIPLLQEYNRAEEYVPPKTVVVGLNGVDYPGVTVLPKPTSARGNVRLLKNLPFEVRFAPGKYRCFVQPPLPTSVAGNLVSVFPFDRLTCAKAILWVLTCVVAVADDEAMLANPTAQLLSALRTSGWPGIWAPREWLDLINYATNAVNSIMRHKALRWPVSPIPFPGCQSTQMAGDWVFHDPINPRLRRIFETSRRCFNLIDSIRAANRAEALFQLGMGRDFLVGVEKNPGPVGFFTLLFSAVWVGVLVYISLLLLRTMYENPFCLLLLPILFFTVRCSYEVGKPIYFAMNERAVATAAWLDRQAAEIQRDWEAAPERWRKIRERAQEVVARQTTEFAEHAKSCLSKTANMTLAEWHYTRCDDGVCSTTNRTVKMQDLWIASHEEISRAIGSVRRAIRFFRGYLVGVELNPGPDPEDGEQPKAENQPEGQEADSNRKSKALSIEIRKQVSLSRSAERRKDIIASLLRTNQEESGIADANAELQLRLQAVADGLNDIMDKDREEMLARERVKDQIIARFEEEQAAQTIEGWPSSEVFESSLKTFEQLQPMTIVTPEATYRYQPYVLHPRDMYTRCHVVNQAGYLVEEQTTSETTVVFVSILLIERVAGSWAGTIDNLKPRLFGYNGAIPYPVRASDIDQMPAIARATTALFSKWQRTVHQGPTRCPIAPCEYNSSGAGAKLRVHDDNFEVTNRAQLLMDWPGLNGRVFAINAENLGKAAAKRTSNRFNAASWDAAVSNGRLNEAFRVLSCPEGVDRVDVLPEDFIKYAQDRIVQKHLTEGESKEWLTSAHTIARYLTTHPNVDDQKTFIRNLLMSEDLKVFIKNEFYTKTDTTLRFIVSPSIYIKVVFGTAFRKVEEILYGRDDLKRHHIKHLTQEQMAEKLSKIKPGKNEIIAQLDYSAYEASQGKPSLDFEYSVYESYLKEDSLAMTIIKTIHQRNTCSYGPLILKNRHFSLEAGPMRLSGMPNTACGNLIMNWVNLTAACGFSWKDEFVCEGDDTLVVCDQKQLDQIKTCSLFPTTYDTASQVSELEFCGYHLDEWGYMSVRDEETFISSMLIYFTSEREIISPERAYNILAMRIMCAALRYRSEASSAIIDNFIDKVNAHFSQLGIELSLSKAYLDQWVRQHWWEVENRFSGARLDLVPLDVKTIPHFGVILDSFSETSEATGPGNFKEMSQHQLRRVGDVIEVTQAIENVVPLGADPAQVLKSVAKGLQHSRMEPSQFRVHAGLVGLSCLLILILPFRMSVLGFIPVLLIAGVEARTLMIYERTGDIKMALRLRNSSWRSAALCFLSKPRSRFRNVCARAWITSENAHAVAMAHLEDDSFSSVEAPNWKRLTELDVQAHQIAQSWRFSALSNDEILRRSERYSFVKGKYPDVNSYRAPDEQPAAENAHQEFRPAAKGAARPIKRAPAKH